MVDGFDPCHERAFGIRVPGDLEEHHVEYQRLSEDALLDRLVLDPEGLESTQTVHGS